MKIFSRSIELAKALFPADFADRPRTFHLTLVWDKNKLLGIGENSLKTSPRNLRNVKHFDCSKKGCCSELAAFITIKNKIQKPAWDKYTFINIRMLQDGSFGLAAPCLPCQNLIEYLGIKKLLYTNESGKFKRYKKRI